MKKNRRDGSCNTNGQVTLSGAPLLANLIMARRYIVARRSYHLAASVRILRLIHEVSCVQVSLDKYRLVGVSHSGSTTSRYRGGLFFSNHLEPTNDLSICIVRMLASTWISLSLSISRSVLLICRMKP